MPRITKQSVQQFGSSLSGLAGALAEMIRRNQMISEVDQARQQSMGIRPKAGFEDVQGQIPVERQLDQAKFIQMLLPLIAQGNPNAQTAFQGTMATLPKQEFVTSPKTGAVLHATTPLAGQTSFREVLPGVDPMIEQARQELGTANLTETSRNALNEYIQSKGGKSFPKVETEQRGIVSYYNDPRDKTRYKITYNPLNGKELSREAIGPIPETAEMQNKRSSRELVIRSIDGIRELSKRIITKIGPAQRIDAIKRGAEAVFGNDPEFRTYQDARMALAGNLAVAQQGSRPSDADIQAIWMPMVPDAYRDTEQSAEMKWKLIEQMSLPEEQGEKKEKGKDLRNLFD